MATNQNQSPLVCVGMIIIVFGWIIFDDVEMGIIATVLGIVLIIGGVTQTSRQNRARLQSYQPSQQPVPPRRERVSAPQSPPIETSEKANFCPYCGEPLKGNFCSQCGKQAD